MRLLSLDMPTISVFIVYISLLIQTAESKFHGDACSTRPNGTCTDMSEYYCPAGSKLERRGCGKGLSCCYPIVVKQPKFVYGNTQCGVTSRNWDARIIGGELAYISQYPWTVTVEQFGQPVCGGSIIADKWILTAAHCVEEHDSTYSVLAGTSYSWIKFGSYRKRYQISSIHIVDCYNADQPLAGYDIALIKLRRRISLGGTLTRSVCLPDRDDDFTDHSCVITGWGNTVEPENPETTEFGSTRLRAATLPIVSRAKCTEYLEGKHQDYICAGYKSGGEDACQGDSGGPLVCKGSDGIWKQVGVISSGNGCGRAGELAMFTSVSKYSSWIHETIKANS